MASLLLTGSQVGDTRGTRSGTDGAVMVCEINEVNDRPVGKPQEQGVMNIAASFFLSKKPRLSIQ
jgi:hypothetical protein